MDLSKVTQTINKILPSVVCDDIEIISVVATTIEQKEKEKLKRKQDFLQAIEIINGLKIDDSAYSFEKVFQEKHPILGDLKNNIFFEKPLFEAIQVGMKEPQYTTALDWFLKNDQEACRLFVETLAEVANFPPEFKDVLPAKGTLIESTSEERGSQNEGKEASKADKPGNNKKKHGSKEIDNLFIWARDKGDELDGKYGIVVEIKFGADLHNDLPCYQKIALGKMGFKPFLIKCPKKKCSVLLTKEKLNCDDCQKKNRLACVVLSTNRISAQEIENEKNKGCRKIWHRVLWCHFLPKLSEKMAQYHENGDYRRFLSSLWRKVFETEG